MRISIWKYYINCSFLVFILLFAHVFAQESIMLNEILGVVKRMWISFGAETVWYSVYILYAICFNKY